MTTSEETTHFPMGQRFLEVLKGFFRNKSRIQILIYSYPLFIHERVLFKHLRLSYAKEHSRELVYFLNQLVLEGFPNGIEQMITSSEELDFLTSRIEFTPTVLRSTVLKGFLQTQIQENSLLQLVNYNEELFQNSKWTFWGEKQIAQGLTERDSCLVQAIGLTGFKRWLENENDEPVAMRILGTLFTRTVNWLAFQLVSELDIDMRNYTIKKLTKIGILLMKNGNFHSAMQVSMAFNKATIHPQQVSSETNNFELSRLCELSNPLNNFEYYRHLLETFPVRDKRLPAIPVLIRDLRLTYEQLRNFRGKVFPEYEMQDLAINTKLLMNFRNVCSSTGLFDGIGAQLSSFEEIEDATIEAYSALGLKSELHVVKDVPKDLSLWNSLHLIGFILRETGDASIVNSLFRDGFYSGKKIINKLDQNVRYFENWPYRLKITIDQLYEKHKREVAVLNM